MSVDLLETWGSHVKIVVLGFETKLVKENMNKAKWVLASMDIDFIQLNLTLESAGKYLLWWAWASWACSYLGNRIQY